MRQLRALSHLAWMTFTRQLFARKTLVVAGLFAMICMATVLYVRRHHPGPEASDSQLAEETVKFVQRILMGVYLSFLLPITALIYATAAIGEEREQRTLVYLLSRPLARYRIYLAKAAGILPATVLVGLSGFWAICQTAGELGEPAWNLFFPAIARACLAYGALFLLFGAAFPRPAVLGVVYSLFVETTLGNMPGTIKRIAVSYYCQCMMFDAGSEIGLSPESRNQFVPIAGDTAAMILDIAVIALLVIGAVHFHRKEYRDLT